MKRAAVFLAVCLGAGLMTSCAKEAPPQRSTRVILIGIDGATWHRIDPLVQAGRMPNLKSLIDEGAHAYLKTMMPSRSPALWTSVATGKNFDKHGINDFTAATGKDGEDIQRIMHMTSNMRRTKALWNILSDAGKKVAFVGWWCTWPAEKVNGYMVSSYVPLEQTGGRGAPTKGTLMEGKSGQTWPPELFQELRPYLLPASHVTYDQAKRFMDIEPVDMDRDIVEGFRWAYAADETYRRSALHILEKDPNLDLIGVYFNGVDVMCHRYWKYIEPEKYPPFPVKDIARFGKSIDEYYVYTDGLIGELLKHRRPGDTIFVLSDHGFHDHGHDDGPDGIFIAAGQNIVKKPKLGQVRLVDIAPTVLALLDMDGAQDMDGRVVEELFPKAWQKAYPKEQVATYDTGDWQAQTPIPSDVDEELMNRLKALGYVK
ncbi:MAG TPA: alkaline phosphatase family protein [bacterium]|nr:alkaline phosphatase family protein [bacterium]